MTAVADLLKGLISPEDWLVMAGSAAVVTLMVAVGALLGFRQRERIGEASLRALAAAEGANVRNVLMSPADDAGIAWLDNRRVLVARVMADGVSARVATVGQVVVGDGRVRVASSDLGFPALDLRYGSEPPAWLAEIARR